MSGLDKEVERVCFTSFLRLLFNMMKLKKNSPQSYETIQIQIIKKLTINCIYTDNNAIWKLF